LRRPGLGALEQALARLEGMSGPELVADRYARFRKMGNFFMPAG